ncbi:hypothetical protein ES705_07118 [subsurface metagenome]
MVEEVKLPTYETLLTEAIRSLAVDSGTVSSLVYRGGNKLTDSTKNWAANVHKNRLVKIVRGGGAGQLAVIDGNSANTLVIKGSWPQPICGGDVYVILEKDLAQILRDVFGSGSDISAANPLETHDLEVKAATESAEERLNGPSVVLEEMAPFNTLYLPLSETATAESTTTVDHYPAEDRAWYVSKVYITTTTNTTAKLKIRCDNDGVLGDVEATVPKATTALEIDLKAEYGMPLRVVQLTAEYVNDGLADEDQALIIKGAEVIERW